jgi:aspartate/methionine/tyrosine aminotransferase
MTIGEPKHVFPAWVPGIIADHAAGFGRYPTNEGTPELLTAISGWLNRRYGTEIGAERLMALNGTREGLFNAVIALCPEKKRGKQPAILTPTPFYQVYAVAALSVGAEPVYVPATAATGFLPDYAALPEDLLDRTAIAFICSPGNPQGAVATEDYWADLLALAEKHDFIVFADECYSEIYRDTPPPGVLAAAARADADPERVFAFHSLSKRSNLPGLRSGFVAGGPKGIAAIRQLRAYAGAPMPLPLTRSRSGHPAHRYRALEGAGRRARDRVEQALHRETAGGASESSRAPHDGGALDDREHGSRRVGLPRERRSQDVAVGGGELDGAFPHRGGEVDDVGHGHREASEARRLAAPVDEHEGERRFQRRDRDDSFETARERNGRRCERGGGGLTTRCRDRADRLGRVGTGGRQERAGAAGDEHDRESEAVEWCAHR